MRSKWLIAGILCSGCATTPDPPTPLDTFAKLEGAPAPAIEAVEVPPRPLANTLTAHGEEHVAFAPAEFEKMERYDEALRANTEILKSCIAAFESSNEERKYLIQAARLTEQRANFLAERLYVAQTDNASMRATHTIETWLHRLFILGILAVKFNGI